MKTHQKSANTLTKSIHPIFYLSGNRLRERGKHGKALVKQRFGENAKWASDRAEARLKPGLKPRLIPKPRLKLKPKHKPTLKPSGKPQKHYESRAFFKNPQLGSNSGEGATI